MKQSYFIRLSPGMDPKSKVIGRSYNIYFPNYKPYTVVVCINIVESMYCRSFFFFSGNPNNISITQS